MRITRAAKVAAFPLTVLVLVALVACQGPVGLTGVAGGMGDIGPAGGTGPKGPQGDSALASLELDPSKLRLLVNDKFTYVNDEPRNEGPGTGTFNMSSLFFGGVGTVKFSSKATNGDAVATEDNGSTVTVSFKDHAAVTAGPAAYTDGFMITVTAKDDAGVTQTNDIMVYRNRHPSIDTSNTAAIPGLLIGEQPGEYKKNGYDADRTAAPFVCKTYNACKLTLVQPTDANTAEHFADDVGALIYSASIESDDQDNLAAMTVDDGKAIMLTGLKTTKVKDVVNTVENGITVTVTAEDEGGLTRERTFQVAVDAMPVATDETFGPITIRTTDSSGITFDLSGFFSDPDLRLNQEIDYTVMSDASLRVTATIEENSSQLKVDAGSLRGSYTVVVRATEEPGRALAGGAQPPLPTGSLNGVGQWVERSFTVTNDK